MKQTTFAQPPFSGRGKLAGQRAGGLLILLSAAAMSGCALRGAPSFVLFGAFFPACMLLAAIAILVAIGTRVALVATGLAEILPLQLFVCVSIGLTVTILIWLLWFES
jgi:hypothetical protein